jgi:hypothetical protein
MRFCINLILFLVLSTLSYSQVIQFSGDFEGGNMISATKRGTNSYVVHTRSDMVGRWFYFKIEGVKDKLLTVKIDYTDVRQAVYSYDNENWFRFKKGECITKGFRKKFTEDEVYVAYCFPYSFTRVQEHINSITKNKYVQIDTLGYSQEQRPIIQLHITDTSITNTNKKRVWIHSRTHPGETPSSFLAQGIIENLLNGSDSSQLVLQQFEFFIVPCINPDGVVGGYSRTNANKVDIEREYNKEEYDAEIETIILRDAWRKLMDEKPIDLWLNLHSEVAQKATFFVHTEASTTSNLFYTKNLFAHTVATYSSFLKHSDIERRPLDKIFLEHWLFTQYGEDALALTYETPYDYFSTRHEVTPENLFIMGAELVTGIKYYFNNE